MPIDPSNLTKSIGGLNNWIQNVVWLRPCSR